MKKNLNFNSNYLLLGVLLLIITIFTTNVESKFWIWGIISIFIIWIMFVISIFLLTPRLARCPKCGSKVILIMNKGLYCTKCKKHVEYSRKQKISLTLIMLYSVPFCLFITSIITGLIFTDFLPVIFEVFMLIYLSTTFLGAVIIALKNKFLNKHYWIRVIILSLLFILLVVSCLALVDSLLRKNYFITSFIGIVLGLIFFYSFFNLFKPE